jgi:hypothetical protein
MAKSVVREMFFLRTQVIDGACAALLHLTQSEKVKNYYKNRHMRLSYPRSTTDALLHCQPRHDKFLQVTLDRSLTVPFNRKRRNSCDNLLTEEGPIQSDEEDCNYVAMYVRHYFQAKEKNKHLSTKLLSVTRRLVKQLIALISILFPGLLNFAEQQSGA